MKKEIEQIMNKANNFTNFQEACYFIISELEKLIPDYNKREKVIFQIENIYNTKLVY